MIKLWKQPSCYVGYAPTRDYELCGVHRESDGLSRANWKAWQAKLQAVADTLPEFDQPEELTERGQIDPRSTGWFYTWRATHPAVGWIDTLMLRSDAPQALIDIANKIQDDLDDYPVVDDDVFSEVEDEDADLAWRCLSIEERTDLLAKAGVDLTLAHQDWPPSDDQGFIHERLLGY